MPLRKEKNKKTKNFQFLLQKDDRGNQLEVPVNTVRLATRKKSVLKLKVVINALREIARSLTGLKFSATLSL